MSPYRTLTLMAPFTAVFLVLWISAAYAGKAKPGIQNAPPPRQPATGNNSCKVMKRIPIPDGKVYTRCKAETINCHSN